MLELSREDLLVLFELCHRICETDKVAASHPAEVVIIDKIAGQLERALAEPFSPDYTDTLSAARSNILDAYELKMGKKSWIHKVALEQV
jgi:hypothetical protein